MRLLHRYQRHSIGLGALMLGANMLLARIVYAETAALPFRHDSELPGVSWSQWLSGMLLAIAVAVVAVFVLKRINEKRSLNPMAGGIQIREVRRVGVRSSLVVVEVAGQTLLFTQNQDQLVYVKELPSREPASINAEAT